MIICPPYRPTLLISDSDSHVAWGLAREAEQLGFEPIVDTNNENLEELARVHRPAVILLDLQQKRDGRDQLALLKKDANTREAKVVMLTGVDDPFVRRTCLELGAEDVELMPPGPIFMKRVARMVGLEAA